MRLTRTARHLTRREFADPLPPGFGDLLHLSPWRRKRLTYSSLPKTPLDADWLVAALHNRPVNMTLFIDSSIVDARTSPRLWSALLDRPRGITIVPSVGNEIGEWLGRHSDHPLVEAVSLDDPAVEIWEKDAPPNVEPAVYWYYVHLLALRKRMFRVVEWQLGEARAAAHGFVSEQDVFKAVQLQFGERGRLLAKRGREGAGNPNIYTDEKLVAAAVLHGISTGRPTCILTKDEDIHEQFYKCCWLLDTQYRGFLMARHYADEPNAYKTTPFKIAKAGDYDFFDAGDHLLLHRNSSHLRELLPEVFHPIALRCILSGAFYARLLFMAEFEMTGLLEAKAQTRGLNTLALDGRNCHVWVPIPFPSVAPYGYAAIGYDRRISLPHTTASVSMMDVSHAVQTNERFGAL